METFRAVSSQEFISYNSDFIIHWVQRRLMFIILFSFSWCIQLIHMTYWQIRHDNFFLFNRHFNWKILHFFNTWIFLHKKYIFCIKNCGVYLQIKLFFKPASIYKHISQAKTYLQCLCSSRLTPFFYTYTGIWHIKTTLYPLLY